MNQKFVIATSTKISIENVDVTKIDDDFFAREKVEEKEGEEALFDTSAAAPKVTVTSAVRKAAQVEVDAALLKNIEKVEFLGAYLKALFKLSKADKPHLLKF